MTRELVLDTETTGTEPRQGDRLCEIGIVEMIDHRLTGRSFHRFVNPERDMPEGAFAVHGLSAAFLSDKPVFAEIADDLLAFLADGVLVIHNAPFDCAFLNAEFERLGFAPGKIVVGDVVDTLILARRKFPNQPNNLDALCTRFGIDRSARTKHGALLDAQLTAEVYLDLLGDRQAALDLAGVVRGPVVASAAPEGARVVPASRTRSRLTDEDRVRHAAFVETLGPDAVWRGYLGKDGAGA